LRLANNEASVQEVADHRCNGDEDGWVGLLRAVAAGSLDSGLRVGVGGVPVETRPIRTYIAAAALEVHSVDLGLATVGTRGRPTGPSAGGGDAGKGRDGGLLAATSTVAARAQTRHLGCCRPAAKGRAASGTAPLPAWPGRGGALDWAAGCCVAAAGMACGCAQQHQPSSVESVPAAAGRS
jgi:hypothetical protein